MGLTSEVHVLQSSSGPDASGVFASLGVHARLELGLTGYLVPAPRPQRTASAPGRRKPSQTHSLTLDSHEKRAKGQEVGPRRSRFS